jgi:hypothetical protein
MVASVGGTKGQPQKTRPKVRERRTTSLREYEEVGFQVAGKRGAV